MNLHKAAALKTVCCRANTLQGTGKEPGQVCASSPGGTEAVDSQTEKAVARGGGEEGKDQPSEQRSWKENAWHFFAILKGERSGQCSTAGRLLFFFFFYLSPLPLNVKNPSKVSEKLSNQDKNRPWAHHLSLFCCPRVQSRAMVTSLFFFL